MTKLSELVLPTGIPYQGSLLPLQTTQTPFSFSRITLRQQNLLLALSSIHSNGPELARHVADQVNGWLRAQARRALCEEVEKQKLHFGFAYKSVSVKDTRSRWGSCSGRGNLNFSWRLIMAPESVLSYVVTHETAHLQHLDHSGAFWNLVQQRCPDFQKAKGWLKQNGASLMNWEFSIR